MDKTEQKIITLLLNNTEQIVTENMALRKMISQFKPLDIHGRVEFVQDLQLKQKIQTEFQPLYEMLDDPEKLHEAVLSFKYYYPKGRPTQH